MSCTVPKELYEQIVQDRKRKFGEDSFHRAVLKGDTVYFYDEDGVRVGSHRVVSLGTAATEAP